MALKQLSGGANLEWHLKRTFWESLEDFTFNKMENSNVKTNTPGGNQLAENPSTVKVAEAGILGASNSISKGQKVPTKYQAAKRELENARYILKKAEEAIEKGGSNSGHEEQIVWAKSTINRLTSDKMNSLKQLSLVERRNILKTEAASKRGRSKPSVDEDDNKKQKMGESNPRKASATILDNVPYCEIVKLNLRVCIVDASDPEWKIPHEKFNIVERHLVNEVFSFAVNNPYTGGPVFKMKERYKGHHIVACDTQDALNFVRFVVGKLVESDLWPGAALEVKHLHELPLPCKLFVALPDVEEKDRENFDTIVTTVIKCQNPHLNVKAWRIIRKVKLESLDKVLVTFVIDKDSKALLEENPSLNFGLRCCRTRVNNTNFEINEKELVDQLVDNLTMEEEQRTEESSEEKPTC